MLSAAVAAFRAGEIDDSRRLLEEAATAAKLVTQPSDRVHPLLAVVGGLVRTGRAADAGPLLEAAEAAARSIDRPPDRVEAMVAVAEAATDAGWSDGGRLLSDAEQFVQSVTDPRLRDYSVIAIIEALGPTGATDRMEANARSVAPEHRAWALATASSGAFLAGQIDETRRLLAEAEAAARETSVPVERWSTLGTVAWHAAVAGMHDDARRLRAEAVSIAAEYGGDVDALLEAARGELATGHADEAQRLLADAETTAQSRAQSWNSDSGIAKVVKALTATGEIDRAKTLAYTIANSEKRAASLIVTAVAARTLAPDTACGLVASAICHGRWDKASKIAASIEPATLTAIRNELVVLGLTLV
jgi:hypothetical protein